MVQFDLLRGPGLSRKCHSSVLIGAGTASDVAQAAGITLSK